MNTDKLRNFSLDWGQLNSLFSVILILDDSLQILHNSVTVDKYLGEPIIGTLLTEQFEIVRPTGIKDANDLDSASDLLFLLTARSGDFAIRGQVTRRNAPGGIYYYFLGAPWLAWIEQKSSQIRMKMDDFAKQDNQLDQLFYISSEKQMVNDLEELTVELREARDLAEQASREKSDFFAVMSHEIRTPLNGVINALGMLDTGRFSLHNSTLIKVADVSARNLLSVTNYVLDYSKIEKGKFAFESNDFDVPRLLRSVTDILGSKADENNVSLGIEIVGEFPHLMSGDDAKLRQVLINLVNNAIKFSPGGNVRMHVEKIGESRDAASIRFAVSDNGIGVPRDKREKIFDAFYSNDRGNKDLEQGTGLGLDICRRLVNAMGGKIRLESAPGQGSTFWFEVDLGVTNKPSGVDDESPDSHGSRRWFSGRVLLVDDNPTNLMLGQMMLERLGVNVNVATSGEEAVNMVKQSSYDMVFMDITMPGMDGIEATSIIHENPDLKDLPIVALTAHVSTDARKKYLSSGMRGYLSKPIDKKELAETLAQFLGSAAHFQQDSLIDSSSGLVNEDQIGNLHIELGADNFDLVFKKIIEELEVRTRDIEEANTSGDAKRVALEAHTLSSSVRSLGCDQLADKLKEVERFARDGQLEPIDIEEINALIDSSVSRLNEIASNLELE